MDSRFTLWLGGYRYVKSEDNTAARSKEKAQKGEGQMSIVKCEICNKEAMSLFIVSHKERGRIRICGDCLKQEGPKLLTQKSCSCGC